MILGDTIAAIASAPGHAPRAVVRISGPLTGTCLLGLADTPPESRGASVVRVSLSGLRATIPCVVVRYTSPASYTGEHGAELIVPGGPHLAGAVLNTLLGIDGVRRATPGEFTVRALLAGKLAPEQAESVGALIAARSTGELAAAHRVLTGESGGAYRALCAELTQALALVEAGIDFADHEDVVAIAPDDLGARLEAVRGKLDVLVSRSAPNEFQTAEPLVVIAGPPNAGKSTLVNRMVGWDRAIVSDTPGTTRDVLEHTVDLHPGRVRVRLADTAGLDASLADASRAEFGAQQQSTIAIDRASVVIWCDPDAQFEGAPESAVLVRTKADLPCDEHDDRVIDVCALDGRGILALVSEIAERALAADVPGEWSVLPRHADALREAHNRIKDALDLLSDSAEGYLDSPELLAHCMRSALDTIGTIVGDVTPDDIIGRIQTTFCVGK